MCVQLRVLLQIKKKKGTCHIAVTISCVTYHTLSVTILSTHREIQSEQIAIDNIDIARFRSSEGVDTSIEWFISANLNGDSSVFTID